MSVIRFLTTIFVFTLFLSPAVNADERKIRELQTKFRQQLALENEKLIEAIDLSDDERSFQIRDIKIGYPQSKVKKLYPDSDGQGQLIYKPNERLNISGSPIKSIFLTLTSGASGDDCKEQFDKTRNKLIKKYGKPNFYDSGMDKQKSRRGDTILSWFLTWVPKSQEKSSHHQQSKLSASMKCSNEQFRFDLTAIAFYVEEHMSLIRAQQQKIFEEGYKKIRLENTPVQEMNF